MGDPPGELTCVKDQVVLIVAVVVGDLDFDFIKLHTMVVRRDYICGHRRDLQLCHAYLHFLICESGEVPTIGPSPRKPHFVSDSLRC